MKKTFTLLLICCTTQVFAIKGLYVDGFASILGNTNKEDSLLNYAQQNGFTYLALYELHLIHASNNLTTVPTSSPLALFISKAKTIYGITEVGACSENFWWFDNVVSVYNSIHPDPNEQFDVYNFEFEFWNTSTVSSGQYYCTTYLTPGGYSCDTAGAFAFYMKELKSIDSLASVDGVKSEIYLGWFNQYQATQMKTEVDRILLHSYVNNIANAYSYAQTRLMYLGNTAGSVDVIPLFSSESTFLGPYLTSNPEFNVHSTYLNDFNNAVGSWKANINLLGYQWFAYTFMPYGLPLSLEEEINILMYPNPIGNYYLINNPHSQRFDITVMKVDGTVFLEFSDNNPVISIPVESWPTGTYHLFVRFDGQTTHKTVIKA